MGHLEYLFAAYSVIFIALFLYLLIIGRKQAKLEDSLAELEKMLSERLGSAAASRSRESV